MLLGTLKVFLSCSAHLVRNSITRARNLKCIVQESLRQWGMQTAGRSTGPHWLQQRLEREHFIQEAARWELLTVEQPEARWKNHSGIWETWPWCQGTPVRCCRPPSCLWWRCTVMGILQGPSVIPAYSWFLGHGAYLPFSGSLAWCVGWHQCKKARKPRIPGKTVHRTRIKTRKSKPWMIL